VGLTKSLKITKELSSVYIHKSLSLW